jgi:hypothetical protein
VKGKKLVQERKDDGVCSGIEVLNFRREEIEIVIQQWQTCTVGENPEARMMNRVFSSQI